MSDQRTLELMNLAIDGQATPAELAELQHLLVTSVDARVTYESLQSLSAELDAERYSEPPPSMKEEILAALRSRHGVVPFSSRSRKRVLAAAAAAAFLALALVAIVRRDGVEAIDAGATMSAREPRGVIEEEANGAKILLRLTGNTVDVTASGPASAELAWDPLAFRPLESSPQLSDTPQIARTGKVPLGASGSLRLQLSPIGSQKEAGSAIAVTAEGRELVRVTIPGE
jgi:hypothetical protein